MSRPPDHGRRAPVPGSALPVRSAHPERRSTAMAYEVRGVVARSKGAPVTVETIVVPDPGPGEAVGDGPVGGGGGTDPHHREGNNTHEQPFLVRHEGAGGVSAVGGGGTNVVARDVGVPTRRG